MNNSTPRTPRTIRLDDGWSIPTSDGIHRRTLVEATAWTVPVVAVALATPAAAASATPTLTFTQSSYSGKACGTITGVQVKRTTDGTTADSGKTITVTLKDGYTFKDGSKSYSGTTDANGLITLPDITVAPNGGDSVFSASSTDISASAPVTAPRTATAFRRDGDGNVSSYDKVPADSAPLGDSMFRAPNGDVYQGNTVVATGTTSASWSYNRFSSPEGDSILTYVKGGKGYRRDNKGNGADGGTTTGVTLPNKSVAIGDGTYRAPNGDVYKGGTVIISGTDSAIHYFNQSSSSTASQNITTYVKDGVARRRDGDGNESTYATVPSGSTPIGDSTYLTKDGTIYHGNTVIATGVSSATWTYNRFGGNAGNNIYTYVKDGKGYRVDNEGNGSDATSTGTTLPTDSVALADGTFRAPNGDIYKDGKVVVSRTDAAVSYFNQSGSSSDFQSITTYTQKAVCK